MNSDTESSSDNTSLQDVDSESTTKPRVNTRVPRTLFMTGLALGLFTIVFLLVVPIIFIPSTFDPRQHCGVPLLGFICVQVPITLYGLMRWLAFPFIRPNAVKFQIAASVFDTTCVAYSALVVALGGLIIRPSFVSQLSGCSNLLIGLMPLGGIIITIWNFLSVGKLRNRITGSIVLTCALIYIAVLFGYIVASGRPD